MLDAENCPNPDTQLYGRESMALAFVEDVPSDKHLRVNVMGQKK